MAINILIIEDDPLALYGLSKALKRQALEVITAPTGKTALEKICTSSFDLCLVNMQLKDCDAVELIKKINGLSPLTKIIVMSARSLNHRNFINKISHPEGKGTCYFMTKPFNLCQMNTIVEQALATEDFPGEFGLAENETAKRRCKRIVYHEKIRLFLNVVDPEETNRWSSLPVDDAGPGEHWYGPVEETYYCLRGRLTLSWDGEGESGEIAFGPDEAVYLAPGWHYRLRNSGEETAFFTYSMYPSQE